MATFHFSVNSSQKHDFLRIFKKDSANSPSYVVNEHNLDVRTREFVDDYNRDGNLYAVGLFKETNDGSKLVDISPYQTIETVQFKHFSLKDLFHPEELKVQRLANNVLVAVVHQTSDPNTWHETTRSWLAKIENGGFIINDELLYPHSQPPLSNYNDLLDGDIYIMPVQLFDFLSYMSFQVEKADYTYSKTIPKKFSVQELLLAIEAAIGRFNAIQPATGFAFQYTTSVTAQTVPKRDKFFIIRLAFIEAIKSLIQFWIDLDYTYNDGVDVEISKKDAYTTYRDSLNEWADEAKQIKSSYLGRGTLVQSLFGFGTTSGAAGNRPTLAEAPWLHTMIAQAGSDRGRNGIFERQLRPEQFLTFERARIVAYDFTGQNDGLLIDPRHG